jgi:colicin import membrane protein
MVLKFSPFEETEFGKEFWQMFWVSMILHLVAILVAAYYRNILPNRIYYAPPSFTAVDLVTMEQPKPVKAPAKRKPAPSKPKAEKKILIPETHKEKAPPKPVKKAEPKPEKVPAKKEPPAKEYSDKEIHSKIANLKKKVDAQRAAEQQAIAARGKITSRLTEIKYQAYQDSIYAIIQNNYDLPAGIHIGQEIEVIIGGKITKQGRIIGLDFVKQSGNEAFDNAVIRSLEKSSPLPPPPWDMEEMEFEMKFSPSGVQQE